MKTVIIRLTVPEDMTPYLTDDMELSFVRNAMILFPFIQNLTISYGRAAEILGVHKTDLIEFYDSLGIPYLTVLSIDVGSNGYRFYKKYGFKSVRSWLSNVKTMSVPTSKE